MKAIVAGITAFVIGLPLGIILLLGGGDSPCGGDGGGPAPSAAAANGIPGNYLQLYQAAGQKYGLPWNLLAAIGSIETDHGRLKAPGVTNGTNSSGAAGPMQFLEGTWQQYKVDGNRDGRKDKYDPRDAIPGAAKYLKASGAPKDLHRAIFAYNHADWYVQKVLAKMREYGASGGRQSAARAASPSAGTPAPSTPAASSIGPPPTDGAAGNCDDGGGATGSGDGTFKFGPGANRPGVSFTPAMAAFVGRMATFYDGKLVVTTGTNHSQFVAGSNRESDHWQGNGADFGMVLNGGTNDGPVGDRIATSAFMAAGLPRNIAIAKARAGGGITVYSNKMRIQVIWKVGGDFGNHHDHVHVGIGRK